jgi:hypothetical protein
MFSCYSVSQEELKHEQELINRYRTLYIDNIVYTGNRLVLKTYLVFIRDYMLHNDLQLRDISEINFDVILNHLSWFDIDIEDLDSPELTALNAYLIIYLDTGEELDRVESRVRAKKTIYEYNKSSCC